MTPDESAKIDAILDVIKEMKARNGNRTKQWCPCCGCELADGCKPGCVIGMPAFVATPAVQAYAAEHGIALETAHVELSLMNGQ